MNNGHDNVFTIRAATPADLGQVRQLFEQGRRFQLSLGFEQWKEGYPADSVLLADISSGAGFVLTVNGNIAGYFALISDGDDEYERLSHIWRLEGRYGVVHRFVVADNCRNKGYASLMLKDAEKRLQCNNIGIMRVDTGVSNLPMQRLMDSSGYTCLGRHDFVWGKRLAYEKEI